jgi:hypothetical protein
MKMGQRICPSCGNEFSGAMEFCPVCTLRKALAGGVESGESSTCEDTVNPASERTGQRFEHYELVTGEDGKPVELGRGAMGVTYKAFDVKQKLVHRDIKPSNIMVNVEEGSIVTAKIIDLGLAKTVNQPGAQTAISTPGIFAGTPEFASPEQFAGVQIDIRSDL